MAGGEGIQASPQLLGTHAAHLDEAALSIAQAANAGRSVGLDVQAYGPLSVGLAMGMQALDTVVAELVAYAGGSVADSAERIRTSSATYEAADADEALGFDQLGGQL